MKKTSFNDFEFIRTLGKGAFSTVYLVRRKIDQKQYALKSIIMEKLKENEQHNNVNEIRILASISHPNVIGYKEAFFNDKNKTLNIVMEYCDDGDLETKIKNMKRNKQKFEECLIWNYALQILGGLKALHDKKILHRDLKSANIFLTKKNNQCKIGDLNASKVMKDKYLINSQTGTPTYSSPEIWQNKPYSYKSDLWSVGCIIYEMCCLRPPFKGKNLDELCENICNGKIEKISSRYSDDLWILIKMLLEVDVNKRVDCNNILNSNFIKDKINEISEIYSDNNYLKTDDDSSLLDTIEYKNFRDLENKIPHKKKYSTIMKKKKKIEKNRNENINIDETIKNDNSVDEFSISENKPINNINKNYSYVNNNNLIFSRNNKDKNDQNNIIRFIKNEFFFNNSIDINKNVKSCSFLTLNNIFFDVDVNENELTLKINKSETTINSSLLKGFIKINYITCKPIIKTKKHIPLKQGLNKYDKNNHLSNIILLPQNRIVKSGLMSLKEDIEKKISQKNIPISSYIKQHSDEPIPIHKISNSNPKFIKQKKNMTDNNSSKNVQLNDNSINKNRKHSLFEPFEKEKSKFQNMKKNPEPLNNDNKMKSGELSKYTGQIKKHNKIKKNGFVARKSKIKINDIEFFDTKKRSDKNVGCYTSNSTIKEVNNENVKKDKIRVITSKNILYNEKINLQNNINKTEISNEEKQKRIIIFSDKIINKHNQDSFDNVNNKNKNKKLKSNKCVGGIKRSSKIIEIDISNNNTLKKHFMDLKNPFNAESKTNNNNMLSASQEFKKANFLNQNVAKHRFSTKENNFKYISNKICRTGDN